MHALSLIEITKRRSQKTLKPHRPGGFSIFALFALDVIGYNQIRITNMDNIKKQKTTTGTDPLLLLFTTRGYKNVKFVQSEGLNTILSATKDNKKCFIKKFNPNGRPAKVNLERIKAETACYKNLPAELLIDAVELNVEEKYIVLNWVDLEDTGSRPDSLEALMEIGLTVLPQIDASFLPEVLWGHYEEVFEKMGKLYEAGFVENPANIIGFFKSKKDKILTAKKAFAHQDFNRRNVKTVNGKIKLFDFELSRRNNAMVDMASLYIDIKDRADLVDTFSKRIKESELYDEELLDLMIIRRSTLFMYSFIDILKTGTKLQFLQNNVDAHKEVTAKVLRSTSSS